MPSLARFLANIRPHFDQLRFDAHAVVCMDKSLFAVTAKFGKAGSQFHKLRRSEMGVTMGWAHIVTMFKAPNVGHFRIYLVYGLHGVYPNIRRIIRVGIFGQKSPNIRRV